MQLCGHERLRGLSGDHSWTVQGCGGSLGGKIYYLGVEIEYANEYADSPLTVQWIAHNLFKDWQTKPLLGVLFLQCGSQASFQVVDEIRIHSHQAVEPFPIISQNLLSIHFIYSTLFNFRRYIKLFPKSIEKS